MADWLAALRVPLVDLAASVGLRIGANVARTGAGPCPACGAVQRGSTDKRGPLRVSRDGLLWLCVRCGVGGDGVLLASYGAGAVAGGVVDYRRLAAWCTSEGLSDASPSLPLRLSPAPSPDVVGCRYPDVAEVSALWSACVPLGASPAVVAWLLDVRRWPQYAVDRAIERDVARVIPPALSLPAWACRGHGARRASWFDGGFVVVFPLWDALGVMRSVLARAIVAGAVPKSVAPTGFDRGGLVLADAMAVGMLAAGRWPLGGPSGLGPYPADCVLVVEGEIDFAAAVASYADREAGQYPAVLGAVQGSLTADVVARVPDGATIAYAGHCSANGALDRGGVSLLRALRDGAGGRLVDGRLRLLLVGAAAAAGGSNGRQ